MPLRETPSLSRRSALRAGAAAGLGLAVPSVGRARSDSEAAELTVATRNLGLGANLFALFLVGSTDELARTVGDLYADIERSAPTERMAAVAGELARTRPDVVGLQEAALVRTESPGDGGAGDPDAGNVAFDFLADLTDALAEAGEAYRVAQVTTNADAEFPGVVDGDRTDVRLTDRDVLLVRADADVAVTDSSSGTYDEALAVPLGGDRTFRVDRGYGRVSGTVAGRPFTAVNTHLESASERVRGAQADELAAVLSDLVGPRVLLGDLNDGPAFEGGAYETLSAGLTDAWAAARPDADGDTCCRATTLDGPGSMDSRVDHVLASDQFAATGARLVGRDEGSRLTATVGGESRTLWPSDHAGVVATLRVGEAGATADVTATETGATAGGDAATEADATADASASASTTETPADATDRTGTGTRTSGGTATAGDAPTAAPTGSSPAGRTTGTATESPGFGVAAGALGVLGGVAELLRRRDGD